MAYFITILPFSLYIKTTKTYTQHLQTQNSSFSPTIILHPKKAFNLYDMKLKSFASFKRKLLKPCKKVLYCFKFKLHKPIFIRSLQNQRNKQRTANGTLKVRRFSKILSALSSLRQTRDMDRITELKSFSEAEHQKAPYSSPITPAYIRMTKKEVVHENEVEDACRSFENYLSEMIVGEGKMRDLVDVEELLYCWKNLKSPIFIDLVCQFYGELCKDLFSSTNENGNGIGTPKPR